MPYIFKPHWYKKNYYIDGGVINNYPIQDCIENGGDRDNILGIKTFKNKINFLKFASLESQISSISDDIAYNNHDIEDGMRANLFSLNEIAEVPFFKKLFNKHKKNIKNYRKEIIVSQIIRDAINFMVEDVINNTKKNIKKYKIKSAKDIYQCSQEIVSFSNGMKEADNQIKYFLNIKMYNNSKVLKKTNEGKIIIENLFKKLVKKPKKYIKRDLLDNGTQERAIADFIAGMTDRFAINLNKIF